MATTVKKNNDTRKVFKKAIANKQTVFAELRDVRDLSSGNCVLVFDEAEVIMPGSWRLQKDLYEGILLIAYWDDDGMFHLEYGC